MAVERINTTLTFSDIIALQTFNFSVYKKGLYRRR